MEAEKKATDVNKLLGRMIAPLSPRLSGDTVPEEREIMRAFSMIIPVIIYMLYVGLLTRLGTEVLNRLADSSEEYAKYISANKTMINACIRTVVILIATALQIPALRGEKPVIVSNDGKLARYFRCCMLALFSSLTLNVLFSLIGFTGSSETYRDVADKQFALPLLMGVLLYGIVSPLAEEVVFRGLVYNRMRRNNVGIVPAMILSSVLFGAYHFNIVQAVYGMFMGLLIVWIYERYGGFLYPVLFHAAANTVVYALSSLNIMGKIMTPVTVAVSGVIMVFVTVMIAKEDKT